MNGLRPKRFLESNNAQLTPPNLPSLVENDHLKKFTFFAVPEGLRMNSPDPVATLCAGDGPAQPAVIRVGGTTSVPILSTAHTLPALLLALVLHDASSVHMVYYYR